MRRLQIITGHYGTGKTEYAVNLALSLAGADKKLALADLDIVNPYFRAYEQAERLREAGIRVIVSSCGGAVDMPAIDPAVLSLFQDKSWSGCTRRILTSCSSSTPTVPRRTTLKRRSRRCAASRPRAVRK